MGDNPQQHNATALAWSAEREFTPYFAEAAASSTKTTQVNLLMGRTVLARASDTMVAIDFPVGNLNTVLSLAATKTRDAEDSLTTIFVQRHSANASVPVLAGASRGKVVRYNGDSGTKAAHTRGSSHAATLPSMLVAWCMFRRRGTDTCLRVNHPRRRVCQQLPEHCCRPLRQRHGHQHCG